MKNKFSLRIFAVAALLIAAAGCQKDDDIANSGSNSGSPAQLFPVSADYTSTALVSDVEEYNPQIIDANLVNAWGIAFSSFGTVWVSAAEAHVSTVYDKNGNTLLPPASTFIIPSTQELSKFIFVTENGTVAAWAPGNPSAVTVADRSSAEAVYKGVEMVNSAGQWYLYATDFHNNKVDIFDQNFNFVGNSMFADATLPAGFAPFNIRKLNDKLYVTYAKQLAPDNEDDESGPGNGYVNIFNLDGTFVQRFVSQGVLNSPWGIEIGRANSGNSPQSQNGNAGRTTILIGNFGDGHINAFDQNGNFLGALMHDGEALEIEGLWGLSYPPQFDVFNDVRNRLYFTAGPDDEEHGVLGFISK